jgi:hypothetical protein
MKPDGAEMLGQIAQTLLGDVAPKVQGEYEQRSVAILGMLLGAIEWDRGAARRVEENAALRSLFAEASPVVRDSGLRARLEQAAAGSDPDLSLRALARANEALRALLIELHSALESEQGSEAGRLVDRVWSELRASTERRRLSIAPF